MSMSYFELKNLLNNMIIELHEKVSYLYEALNVENKDVLDLKNEKSILKGLIELSRKSDFGYTEPLLGDIVTFDLPKKFNCLDNSE